MQSFHDIIQHIRQKCHGLRHRSRPRNARRRVLDGAMQVLSKRHQGRREHGVALPGPPGMEVWGRGHHGGDITKEDIFYDLRVIEGRVRTMAIVKALPKGA